jgi:hypothetical protein
VKRVVPIGFLGIFLIGVFLFYEFSGVRFYLELTDYVGSIQTGEKQSLDAEVFGSESKNTYGGVFLFANSRGIWVWGRGLPRYFAKKDGDSVFYFFDICNKENLARSEQGKQIYGGVRDVYFDINVWQKKLKRGDYTFVRYDAKNDPNLREVWAYGGWYFLKDSLKQQCAR